MIFRAAFWSPGAQGQKSSVAAWCFMSFSFLFSLSLLGCAIVILTAVYR